MTSKAKHCISLFQEEQDELCRGLELLDGSGRFTEDAWERPGGGGGRSRVIEGDLIEKGGVNFSAVHGSLSKSAGKSLGTGAGKFVATGVSIVLHPRNPWMPIIHMNVRYFELGSGTWWFGGGIDLTPHYVVPELAKNFHQRMWLACEGNECADYLKFKHQADDYFYIRHREETRGIGGIFYDRLSRPDFGSVLAFTRDVINSFIPAYTAQADALRNKPYGDRELAWQRQRRGRYVEFNLVWDRGTRFGLETEGRTESILMSLPPQADWTYNFEPDPGSMEAHTRNHLVKGMDWLALEAVAA